jgi:hypothetical protein
MNVASRRVMNVASRMNSDACVSPRVRRERGSRAPGARNSPVLKFTAFMPILRNITMPRDPENPLEDSLRTEEFDALVRVLLPTVQADSPGLSPLEALREAARLAESHMRETAWLNWGRPRL